VAAVDVDVVLEGHFLQRHRKPQCREATRRRTEELGAPPARALTEALVSREALIDAVIPDVAGSKLQALGMTVLAKGPLGNVSKRLCTA
jgi:hypothetical protein